MLYAKFIWDHEDYEDFIPHEGEMKHLQTCILNNPPAPRPLMWKLLPNVVITKADFWVRTQELRKNIVQVPVSLCFA